MNPDQAIMDMKVHLEALYPDLQLLGSDRATFLCVTKALRAVEISVAENDTGWFVELWHKGDTGDDELSDEGVVELGEEAIKRICSWLNG